MIDCSSTTDKSLLSTRPEAASSSLDLALMVRYGAWKTGLTSHSNANGLKDCEQLPKVHVSYLRFEKEGSLCVKPEGKQIERLTAW